jgi:hypothetical protein
MAVPIRAAVSPGKFGSPMGFLNSLSYLAASAGGRVAASAGRSGSPQRSLGKLRFLLGVDAFRLAAVNVGEQRFVAGDH